MTQTFRQTFISLLSLRNSEIALSVILILVPIWWIGWPYWFEPFTSGGALEEQAIISISADNIRANFNWGVGDYGLNGPGLPEDHLFYTHFPTGADVILAMLRTLNFSESLIRQIYILTALSSIPILCLLLNKLGFRPVHTGLITSFFLFGYEGFWSYTDHLTYSFYFPPLFLGVIGLIKIFRKEKHCYLFFITFLTASYVMSFLGFFTLIMAAIISSFFVKQDGKKIRLFCLLTAGTLIFLHLLRNTLVLGLEVASQELLYTLGNRIFGNPTKLAVMDWFRENRIAWWGTNDTSLSNLFGIFRKTLFVHSGLIISLTAIFSRKLLPIILRKPKLTTRRELKEFDVLAILALTSFTWYLFFPHQGKNYYFPPTFHAAGLFAIIACTQFIINEVKIHKFNANDRSVIKTTWQLSFLLIVIPSVTFSSVRPRLNLDITPNKTIITFAFFYLFILIIQAISRNFSVGKTLFVALASVYSFSTIFLIQLIANSSSRVSLSLHFRILFAFGIFVAIGFIFKFIPSTNIGKLRTHVAASLLISLVFVNCLTLLQANLNKAQEARSGNFGSSEVKAFNSLPKLNGNIWTNINAPLLFRYTGGLVNGYCQAKGLLEKNKEYCSSGRIYDPVEADLPSYVVLSEIHGISGDSACFSPKPCFEEVKSNLTITHRQIDSKNGFYIFEEKIGE